MILPSRIKRVGVVVEMMDGRYGDIRVIEAKRAAQAARENLAGRISPPGHLLHVHEDCCK